MCDKPPSMLGVRNAMVDLKETIEFLEESLELLDEELFENPLVNSPNCDPLVSSYNILVRTLKLCHPQWQQEFEYLVDVEGYVRN